MKTVQQPKNAKSAIIVSVPTDILAIDPSLTRSGIAYNHRKDKYVTHTFGISKERGLERLVKLREYFRPWISLTSLLVLEGYSMGSRGQVFDIAEFVGMLKLIAYDACTDVLLVPPSSLKAFVTLNGNADKQRVLDHIKGLWGGEYTDSDEAEAFALLKMGEAYTNRRIARNYGSKRQEILSKCQYIKMNF